MTDVSGVAHGRLRVATLNLFGVRANWDARRTVVRSGLAELQPDLVSLQEVIKTSSYDQALDVLGEEYHFAHHHVRYADGQGDSIASRWPIAAKHEVEVPSRDGTAGLLSSTLVVMIDVPQPIGTVVFVNHATTFELTRESHRERQAVVVADYLERHVAVEPAHVIIAGDLNARPDAASIRYWTGAQSLEGRSVCYRDAWATRQPGVPGHTFTGAENMLTATGEGGKWELEPGRRIDYILVRCNDYGPTLDIGSCQRILDRAVRGVWASDHFAVTADLFALTPTGRPAP
jgi:endonuclease/exonuclease/phosphatase family metal-dependent hydrolase